MSSKEKLKAIWNQSGFKGLIALGVVWVGFTINALSAGHDFYAWIMLAFYFSILTGVSIHEWIKLSK